MSNCELGAHVTKRQIMSRKYTIPAVRLPTIGRRASLSPALAYEILPVDVTSAPSLLTFGKRLSSYAKTASACFDDHIRD